MMRRALVALALLLGWGLAATEARAHAVLVETLPSDGAALERSPPEIRVAFTEPVRLVFLHLLDHAGRQRLPHEAGRSADGIVTAAVPSLEDGSYVLSWRVVSADGHPIGGGAVFRVGAAAAAPVGPAFAADTIESGWRRASAVLRGLVYASVLLAAGGAVFLAMTARYPGHGRDARRRYVLASTAAAAAALVVAIGIEGALLTLPASWAGLLDRATWSAGAAGGLGLSVAVSLAGLGVIAAGLFVRAGWLALAGAALAVAGFGLTGHAATASPVWLSATLVVAHAGAAAVWIGALWPLLSVLRRAPALEAQQVLLRFSRLAVIAVAVLVVAGVVISVLQVEQPAALVTTLYGWILLAKLALVGGLLALAFVNKRWLTPALAADPVRGAQRLRRTIATEVTLAAGVLVATAALGTTPPPRAFAAREDHSHHAMVPGHRVAVASGAFQAEIELVPGRTGANTLTVTLRRGAEGAPIAPLGVEVAFTQPAAGIEPIVRPLAPVASGVYRLEPADLPLAGGWTIRIEALVSDFEQAVFEAEFRVR